ncbi:hypothetical protein GGS20DRAFT_364073 [Poronia punctata]|nr:hypothetical protein GGS20DRAFT_364073 [Poronia punctata]
MASYSKLNDAEKQEVEQERESIGRDGAESESNYLISTTARWGGMSHWRVWSTWLQIHWPSIVAHLGLLSLNLIIVTLYAARGSITASGEVDNIPKQNPLRDRITYQPHRFELLAIYTSNGTVNEHKPTHFTGTPRPELEDAWDGLMEHSEVRVSKEELGGFKNDDSIIQLADGSGFYVTVSAFHGLHCVRRLHKYLWADHYYPDLSDHDSFFLKRHAEHCLDWLRQYVQCHADPTLIPIHWTTNDDVPVSKDTGNRMCVKWEPFEGWMAEHSFNPSTPGLLVHPMFGVPQALREGGEKVALGVHELGTGGLLHADGRKGDVNFNDDPAA